MNALKAFRKKRLNIGDRLGPSSFLLTFRDKYREFPDSLYVNKILPHEVYAIKKPPFQHDISDYDFILVDEKKKRYEGKEFYLGYFKVVK
ncbi:MAG: hypothetical protein QXN71_02415 [Candidatus Aenigmatarchaeota archaeon]